jgi:hypothetical protein
MSYPRKTFLSVVCPHRSTWSNSAFPGDLSTAKHEKIRNACAALRINFFAKTWRYFALLLLNLKGVLSVVCGRTDPQNGSCEYMGKRLGEDKLKLHFVHNPA